jgi:succinate dehydrogenase / fumarate reductase, cytochrome b subunit
MANAGTDERAARRPLSPHLTIFKPWLTMAMSMVHRITGAGLYVGMALLGLYLLGLGFGGWLHALTGWLGSGVIGGLIVFLVTLAIFQHLLGGIRHALWDRGLYMDAEGREFLARASLFGGVGLTVLLWILKSLVG